MNRLGIALGTLGLGLTLSVFRSGCCKERRPRAGRLRRWFRVEARGNHSGARRSFTVYVVQEPFMSFEADVAATRSVLDRSGPCVLVGHSWGGMIITEAGDRPSVRSLVYVAAFEPEIGESAGALQTRNPPAAGSSVVDAGRGFVYVKPEAFLKDVAAGVPRATAHFMAISQVPINADSFSVKVTASAWSKKPTYAVIPKGDRMINPDLERYMASRAKSERSSYREAM